MTYLFFNLEGFTPRYHPLTESFPQSRSRASALPLQLTVLQPENIRDYEYEVTVNFGLEALEYDDIVLINAPFTREVHDEKFLKDFSKKLADHGAKLVVIWVVTKPEICHQRMIDRNSVRDTWKLEHWDEYVKTIDYSIPEALKKMSSCLDLMLFYNSSDEEYQKSMEMVISRLEDE